MYKSIAKRVESDSVIIDGVSSKMVVDKICNKYDVVNLHVDTNYDLRIKHLMNRYKCSCEQAKVIEKEKEDVKNPRGLDELICEADIILDGRKNVEELISEAIVKINEFL